MLEVRIYADIGMLSLTKIGENLFEDCTTLLIAYHKPKKPLKVTVARDKQNGDYYFLDPSELANCAQKISRFITWVRIKATIKDEATVELLQEGCCYSHSYHKRNDDFWLVRTIFEEFEDPEHEPHTLVRLYVESSSHDRAATIYRRLIDGSFHLKSEWALDREAKISHSRNRMYENRIHRESRRRQKIEQAESIANAHSDSLQRGPSSRRKRKT